MPRDSRRRSPESSGRKRKERRGSKERRSSKERQRQKEKERRDKDKTSRTTPDASERDRMPGSMPEDEEVVEAGPSTVETPRSQMESRSRSYPLPSQAQFEPSAFQQPYQPDPYQAQMTTGFAQQYYSQDSFQPQHSTPSQYLSQHQDPYPPQPHSQPYSQYYSAPVPGPDPAPMPSSMPMPIPQPTRPQQPNGENSDTSSTSSSFLNISRKGPSYSRYGGVFNTFFRAPSEHREARNRTYRKKSKKASSSRSKSTNFLSFGNSSSSSVDSDLAYGRGYIPREKDLRAAGIGHGVGAGARDGSSARDHHHYQQRQQSQGLRRPRLGDNAANISSSGRPGRPARSRTDDEILDIGRQLSDIARAQNEADLRGEGKNRPTRFAGALGAAGAAAGAATALSSFRGSRSREGRDRGIGSSKAHGRDDGDSEWESASEDEDSLSPSSSEDGDPELAYGSVANVRDAAPAAAGGHDRRRSSQVDPRLFGPYNSLRGNITPLSFNGDAADERRQAASQAPSFKNEQRPMQRVYPVPTSDPNNFDYDRGSTVSSRQDASRAIRPDPVPIQQPVPKAPISSKVYDADDIAEDGRRRESRHSRSKSDGTSLAGAAAAGVAAAAVGSAMSRRKDRRDEDRRTTERYQPDDYAERDRDRDGRSRSHREFQVRTEDRDHKRSPREDDTYEHGLKRRHTAPVDYNGEVSYKLPEGDEIRVEHGRDRDRRRGHESRDLPKDEPKRITGKDLHGFRPEEKSSESARDKQRVGVTEASAVPRATVDPFQFQVDDFHTPPSTASGRPMTPQVFTVDREPDFGDSSAPIAGPSAVPRLSRKDSYEIEQRAGKRREGSRIRSRTPEPRLRQMYAEEEHAARSIYDEAKHATAPVAASAMASAVAIETERSRERRRDDFDADGSRTRSAAERNTVQEEADRYYRETVIARKIAEDEIRSRSASPVRDRSVVDKYSDEDPKVIIVTPPEMEEEEHPEKHGPYAAPNADVRIDNFIKPSELSRFRLPHGRLTSEAIQIWKSRDPSCERDRPLLNLVTPTPLVTPRVTPTPEKQASMAARKEEKSSSEDTTPDVIIGPKGEVIQTPSSAKSVTWGENETRRFERESSRSEEDEQHPQKTRSSRGKSAGWGILAAAIAGGSDSAKDRNEEGHATRNIDDATSVSRWDQEHEAPPVPGPKPASPDPQGSGMPGSFGDDNEFAAVLAAGLQDTGFDPNIVIDDPTYRRRDSPPGSNGGFYQQPTAETVTDLGVLEDAARSKSAPDRGFVLGEVADTPDRENGPAEDDWDVPTKLSKKERKKREKAAKRESVEVENPSESWQEAAPASEIPIEEEPLEKLSKKERKKREKAAARADSGTFGDEGTSAAAEEDLPANQPTEAIEDDWASTTSKKKKKKGKKSATLDDDGDDKRISVSVDAFDDLHSTREAEPRDDWDVPKQSKKKSKRDSKGSDWAKADDYAENDVDPPDRGGHSFIDDRDVSSVVSDSAAKHRRSEKRSSTSRADDDDNKSVASFASVPEGRKKSSKEAKRSSGSFFGLFGGRNGADGKEEDSKRKSDKDDQQSFLGDAGTLGAGVGMAGAAAALGYAASRSKATDDAPSATEHVDADGARRRSASSPAGDVRFVDPEIFERIIKPAIDPQYGDLLPLPPSEPSSPKPAVDALDNDLPALPESRPETPPEERNRLPQKPTHVRRRSAIETPIKSPSHTAIPIQLRLGQRSNPSSPAAFKSSPMSSPVAPTIPSAAPELSTPRRPARPTSWDSSREIKPLYLLEHARIASSPPLGNVEPELPELPPSESSSRESPVPSFAAEDEPFPDAGRSLPSYAEPGPLSLDTSNHPPTTSEDRLGSQESTPKIEPRTTGLESGVEPSSIDDLPLPVAQDFSAESASQLVKDEELSDLPPLPQSSTALETEAEPGPVEPMSKDRSSYLLHSSPPFAKNAWQDESAESSLDATPSKRPQLETTDAIQEEDSTNDKSSSSWKSVAGAAAGGLAAAALWDASNKEDKESIDRPEGTAPGSQTPEEHGIGERAQEEDWGNSWSVNPKTKKGKKGKKAKNAASENAFSAVESVTPELSTAGPDAAEAPEERATAQPNEDALVPKLSKKSKKKAKNAQPWDSEWPAEDAQDNTEPQSIATPPEAEQGQSVGQDAPTEDTSLWEVPTASKKSKKKKKDKKGLFQKDDESENAKEVSAPGSPKPDDVSLDGAADAEAFESDTRSLQPHMSHDMPSFITEDSKDDQESVSNWEDAQDTQPTEWSEGNASRSLEAEPALTEGSVRDDASDVFFDADEQAERELPDERNRVTGEVLAGDSEETPKVHAQAPQSEPEQIDLAASAPSQDEPAGDDSWADSTWTEPTKKSKKKNRYKKREPLEPELATGISTDRQIAPQGAWDAPVEQPGQFSATAEPELSETALQASPADDTSAEQQAPVADDEWSLTTAKASKKQKKKNKKAGAQDQSQDGTGAGEAAPADATGTDDLDKAADEAAAPTQEDESIVDRDLPDAGLDFAPVGKSKKSKKSKRKSVAFDSDEGTPTEAPNPSIEDARDELSTAENAQTSAPESQSSDATAHFKVEPEAEAAHATIGGGQDLPSEEGPSGEVSSLPTDLAAVGHPAGMTLPTLENDHLPREGHDLLEAVDPRSGGEERAPIAHHDNLPGTPESSDARRVGTSLTDTAQGADAPHELSEAALADSTATPTQPQMAASLDTTSEPTTTRGLDPTDEMPSIIPEPIPAEDEWQETQTSKKKAKKDKKQKRQSAIQEDADPSNPAADVVAAEDATNAEPTSQAAVDKPVSETTSQPEPGDSNEKDIWSEPVSSSKKAKKDKKKKKSAALSWDEPEASQDPEEPNVVDEAKDQVAEQTGATATPQPEPEPEAALSTTQLESAATAPEDEWDVPSSSKKSKKDKKKKKAAAFSWDNLDDSPDVKNAQVGEQTSEQTSASFEFSTPTTRQEPDVEVPPVANVSDPTAPGAEEEWGVQPVGKKGKKNKKKKDVAFTWDEPEPDTAADESKSAGEVAPLPLSEEAAPGTETETAKSLDESGQASTSVMPDDEWAFTTGKKNKKGTKKKGAVAFNWDEPQPEPAQPLEEQSPENEGDGVAHVHDESVVEQPGTEENLHDESMLVEQPSQHESPEESHASQQPEPNLEAKAPPAPVEAEEDEWVTDLSSKKSKKDKKKKKKQAALQFDEAPSQTAEGGDLAPTSTPPQDEGHWEAPLANESSFEWPSSKSKKSKKRQNLLAATLDDQTVSSDVPSEQPFDFPSETQQNEPTDSWGFEMANKKGKKGKKQRQGLSLDTWDDEPQEKPSVDAHPEPPAPESQTPNLGNEAIPQMANELEDGGQRTESLPPSQPAQSADDTVQAEMAGSNGGDQQSAADEQSKEAEPDTLPPSTEEVSEMVEPVMDDEFPVVTKKSKKDKKKKAVAFEEPHDLPVDTQPEQDVHQSTIPDVSGPDQSQVSSQDTSDPVAATEPETLPDNESDFGFVTKKSKKDRKKKNGAARNEPFDWNTEAENIPALEQSESSVQPSTAQPPESMISGADETVAPPTEEEFVPVTGMNKKDKKKKKKGLLATALTSTMSPETEQVTSSTNEQTSRSLPPQEMEQQENPIESLPKNGDDVEEQPHFQTEITPSEQEPQSAVAVQDMGSEDPATFEVTPETSDRALATEVEPTPGAEEEFAFVTKKSKKDKKKAKAARLQAGSPAWDDTGDTNVATSWADEVEESLPGSGTSTGQDVTAGDVLVQGQVPTSETAVETGPPLAQPEDEFAFVTKKSKKDKKKKGNKQDGAEIPSSAAIPATPGSPAEQREMPMATEDRQATLDNGKATPAAEPKDSDDPSQEAKSFEEEKTIDSLAPEPASVGTYSEPETFAAEDEFPVVTKKSKKDKKKKGKQLDDADFSTPASIDPSLEGQTPRDEAGVTTNASNAGLTQESGTIAPAGYVVLEEPAAVDEWPEDTFTTKKSKKDRKKGKSKLQDNFEADFGTATPAENNAQTLQEPDQSTGGPQTIESNVEEVNVDRSLPQPGEEETGGTGGPWASGLLAGGMPAAGDIQPEPEQDDADPSVSGLEEPQETYVLKRSKKDKKKKRANQLAETESLFEPDSQSGSVLPDENRAVDAQELQQSPQVRDGSQDVPLETADIGTPVQEAPGTTDDWPEFTTKKSKKKNKGKSSGIPEAEPASKSETASEVRPELVQTEAIAPLDDVQREDHFGGSESASPLDVERVGDEEASTEQEQSTAADEWPVFTTKKTKKDKKKKRQGLTWDDAEPVAPSVTADTSASEPQEAPAEGRSEEKSQSAEPQSADAAIPEADLGEDTVSERFQATEEAPSNVASGSASNDTEQVETTAVPSLETGQLEKPSDTEDVSAQASRDVGSTAPEGSFEEAPDFFTVKKSKKDKKKQKRDNAPHAQDELQPAQDTVPDFQDSHLAQDRPEPETAVDSTDNFFVTKPSKKDKKKAKRQAMLTELDTPAAGEDPAAEASPAATADVQAPQEIEQAPALETSEQNSQYVNPVDVATEEASKEPVLPSEPAASEPAPEEEWALPVKKKKGKKGKSAASRALSPTLEVEAPHDSISEAQSPSVWPDAQSTENEPFAEPKSVEDDDWELPTSKKKTKGKKGKSKAEVTDEEPLHQAQLPGAEVSASAGPEFPEPSPFSTETSADAFESSRTQPEPVPDDEQGFAPIKKSKKDKKRAKTAAAVASRDQSPSRDTGKLDQWAVASEPPKEDDFATTEKPQSEDTWDVPVATKKSKKGKKGKRVSLAEPEETVPEMSMSPEDEQSKDKSVPWGQMGAVVLAGTAASAALSDSKGGQDEYADLAYGQSHQFQADDQKTTESPEGAEYELAEPGMGSRAIAAAYLEGDRHQRSTEPDQSTAVDTVDRQNPLGIYAEESQPGTMDDVWGEDTRGIDDQPANTMDDVWGEDTRGIDDQPTNTLDDVWGEDTRGVDDQPANDMDGIWGEDTRGVEEPSGGMDDIWGDSPQPETPSARNIAASYLEQPRESISNEPAKPAKASPSHKADKSGTSAAQAAKAAGAASGVAALTERFGGGSKKKKKGKGKKKYEGKTPGGGEDLFDDPVLWEGADKKHVSEIASAEVEKFWGTEGAIDGDEQAESSVAFDKEDGDSSRLADSNDQKKPSDIEGPVMTGGVSQEHPQTNTNLGREETDAGRRLPTEDSVRPSIEGTDIDEDFETRQYLEPGEQTGEDSHTWGFERGDFRRSMSRSLPPVQEESLEEDQDQHSAQPRKLAAVPPLTPEPNRDSGFISDSPLPARRANLTDSNNRDSGVHMRDVEGATTRQGPNSPEPSWATSQARSLHGKEDVSTPARKLRRSQLSKGDLRDQPTSERTPVLNEPSTQEVTPEPQKPKPWAEETERQSKYGDAGLAAGAGAGAALAGAAWVGRRSVSDQPQGRSSPGQEGPANRAIRRTASNTGLARHRTPEPLKFANRPESPASGILRHSSATPPLRRVDKRVSGDLRSLSQRSQLDLAASTTASSTHKDVRKDKDTQDTVHAQSPDEDEPRDRGFSSTPVANEGRVRAKDMPEVFDGYGEGRIGSPRSPTRPHSMRRRQSMQVLELESRLEQLTAENRVLNEAKAEADANSNQRSAGILAERDAEIDQLKQSVEFFQKEVARLTEVNEGLNSANAQLATQQSDRYLPLENPRGDASRRLEGTRSISGGFDATLGEKDAEIERLRSELEQAREQIREMQRQILASKAGDSEFLQIQDVDHFDHRCQQLCSHVQQWVLRFSKFSDMRACRLTSEINDEKVIDRLDNSVLDGSDVDTYLSDRVKRRDIFMSMTMNMIWDFVFTRYLFGMDREQRQKLKSLEKLLTEVGPVRAVRQWRAVTLTLLARRSSFKEQRDQDTEAVVQAIFHTLAKVLPPPSNLEEQIVSQLRRVMREAVDLSIEMRTQRAEYMMLPPLQPTYDEEGELAETVTFNASLMNERSGDATLKNEDLEAQGVVVRVVLFPLVVKKGDDAGEGDDEIVVCPAQVLVPRSDKRGGRAGAGGANRLLTPSSEVGGISPGSAANKSDISMQTEGTYFGQQAQTPEAEYYEGGI